MARMLACIVGERHHNWEENLPQGFLCITTLLVPLPAGPLVTSLVIFSHHHLAGNRTPCAHSFSFGEFQGENAAPVPQTNPLYHQRLDTVLQRRRHPLSGVQQDSSHTAFEVKAIVQPDQMLQSFACRSISFGIGRPPCRRERCVS